MPNGRTDIFEVKKDGFLFSIRALEGDEAIGVTFGDGEKHVHLSELEKRVIGHENETIEIEEQRNDYYIIRAGDDFYGWVCVTKESRLFSRIKQLHLSYRLP